MIMDWDCYRKRHLGQEDCENNLKLGAACSRRLAQAVRLVCPFFFVQDNACSLYLIRPRPFLSTYLQIQHALIIRRYIV
jgi:hypothetical protein